MSKDKVRLYQLARDLDVESKELLEKLQSIGCDVRNHMSTIDDETRKIAIEMVQGRRPSAGNVAVAEPEAKPADGRRPWTISMAIFRVSSSIVDM